MKVIDDFIDRLPDSWIERFARPYIAGRDIEEGIRTIQGLHQEGIFSTFDILGESADSWNAAQRYQSMYIDAIEQIGRKFEAQLATATSPQQKPVSVSVKPSAICYFERKGTILSSPEYGSPKVAFIKSVSPIIARAVRFNIDVTIDHEDDGLTETTYNASLELRQQGATNVGDVVQSMRYDAQKWMNFLYPQGSDTLPTTQNRVRLCRGIYHEPKEIATSSKRKAKNMLVDCVQYILCNTLPF
ncbi:hypothetical protein COV17_02430 [Candidatus Woesearchaeota archaeon CG10_big_fil_rev_8_21_14_0_10_36_11]|nr:MAG: hypothetical protein COV17_02430 [Candidatus Woesearchaeota archaeon CG10_big_fil_rev_8_21_14_0_10_36_11]